MPLAGQQLQPRAFAAYLGGWARDEQVKAMATSLAESLLYTGAYHDNYGPLPGKTAAHYDPSTRFGVTVAAPGGPLVSRDCGVFQINIPVEAIGTVEEDYLRTTSGDAGVVAKVVKQNVAAAKSLYLEPWVRDGTAGIRAWEPWVAYTSGWAMFPAWWVWHQVDGVPEGPWIATGRFLHRGIRGLANYKAFVQGQSGTTALKWAKAKAARFGIDPAAFVWAGGTAGVALVVPAPPADDPADGVGPRPIPNDGL